MIDEHTKAALLEAVEDGFETQVDLTTGLTRFSSLRGHEATAQGQALGHVRPHTPEVAGDALPDRLQRLPPARAERGMGADELARAMIHGDEHVSAALPGGDRLPAALARITPLVRPGGLFISKTFCRPGRGETNLEYRMIRRYRP